MTARAPKSEHRPWRMIGLWIAVAAAVLTFCSVKAETVHRFDGMCLSFGPQSVSYFTDNPAARRGSPLLALPDGYIPAKSASANGFGLSVSYRKRTKLHREDLLQRAFDPAEGTCEQHPESNGLSLMVSQGNLEIGSPKFRMCGRSIAHTRYIPTDLTSETATLRVTCNINERVKRCGLTTLLDNNWEAKVSIAKADLEHWLAVSRAASSFFSENLTDCGEN